MRILVVDDDEDIIYLVTSRLQSLGYEVSAARDGREGLDLITRIQPEIVILDVSMPRMNGYEVLQELRAMESRRHYVLMLTAEAKLEDVERGFVSGADDYLVKPFTFSELRARIKTLLRRSPSRQPEPGRPTPPGTACRAIRFIPCWPTPPSGGATRGRATSSTGRSGAGARST